MLNSIDNLKKLVGIKPYVLDMDDIEKIPDQTVWELFLESCSMRAIDQIIGWGFEIPETSPSAKLLNAEVLLVKADIIEEFGFQESIDAEQIQTGGQNGETRRYKKLSAEERGEKAQALRDKAYRTISGKIPSSYSGIE